MDARIEGLDTTEKCRIFEQNALRLDRPDLAQECRERVVQIKAEDHVETFTEDKPLKEAELEAIKAVCAYETLLRAKNGRKTRATRTWNIFKKHGIMEGMERVVKRKNPTQGYEQLVERGLEDYAFESVVLRHPDEFSKEAIKVSKKRIAAVETAD